MQDLIEKMKKNEKPFGLLRPEEQECLQSTGKENCEYYSRTTSWTDCFGIGAWCKSDTFRIKSDYVPPVPELPKLEVGQVYIMHGTEDDIWDYGRYKGIGDQGVFVFDAICKGSTFNVGPTRWTFHKIVTEEVGK